MLKAQASIDEIKASLIIQFCNNVIWSKQIVTDFSIGCYCDDESVYNILASGMQKVKVQGKNFIVKIVTSSEEMKSCNAIYFNKSDKKDLIAIFSIIRENNILLITDNYSDQLFVLINLLDDGKKVSFKVNMPNLTLAGFTVKPNLLLNGGSVVDIKAAYEKFEHELNQNIEMRDRTSRELMENEKKLVQKDKDILQKELEIEKYINEIKGYKKESAILYQEREKEQELLKQKSGELAIQGNELKKIQSDIKKQQEELSQIRMKVLMQKNESDNLRSEINQKNITLHQKEDFISNQKRLLFLSLALIASLIAAAFAIARLFLIKKKHNKILEEQVNIRTRELQFKNEQYLSLFNMAPVAIWEADFSSVKDYINSKGFKNEPEYDSYTGSHNEFSIECFRKIRFININNATREIYKIETSDEIFDLYEQVYQAGNLNSFNQLLKVIFLDKKTYTYEAIRLNKLNEIIDVLINWIDVSDKEGTFNRVLLAIVDITKLRKVESELIKYQEHLELLVKERTDEVEALNEELRTHNEELFATNDALELVNRELKQTNDELNLQKQKLNDALQELQNAQIQMVQSEKMASLGVLTAGVAHEINNPLNFIQTGLYALENVIENNTIQEELLVVIYKIMNNINVGVDRASSIVKSLNTFSRKDINLIKTCNIHEIIDNTLLILNHEIKNKYVITKNYADDLFTFEGNEENLHQVFMNIFMNALQSIDAEGEIIIHTKIIDNQNLEIVISDNGKGISKEDLKKIFDPFFTTKEAGKGVGLGLSIVYKIINEHNGSIKYKSELKKGTSVFIQLPVKK